MKFNYIKYNKSFIWAGNSFLVNPETSAKKCSLCKKSYYSIEFPDVDGFDDNKLPVCGACCRKKKNQAKIDELTKDVKKVCKKCKQEKPVGQFTGRKGEWIEIKTTCNDCRSMPKKLIQKISEE